MAREAACELLVNDYTKGYVDGLALRFADVINSRPVRKPRRCFFVSAIIREQPLRDDRLPGIEKFAAMDFQPGDGESITCSWPQRYPRTARRAASTYRGSA